MKIVLLTVKFSPLTSYIIFHYIIYILGNEMSTSKIHSSQMCELSSVFKWRVLCRLKEDIMGTVHSFTFWIQWIRPTFLILMEKGREREKKSNWQQQNVFFKQVQQCLKRKIMKIIVSLFESGRIAWSMFIQCSPSLKLIWNPNHFSTHFF